MGDKRIMYKGLPKIWPRGGQRSKLRHDSKGCPLHFWPSERRDGTVNSFHATFTRCKKKKKKKHKLFSLFSWYFQMATNNRIFDFFCCEASEPTLVAVVAKPEVKIAATKSFSPLARFKPFYHFNHFQLNQANVFVPLVFLHFPLEPRPTTARYYS